MPRHHKTLTLALTVLLAAVPSLAAAQVGRAQQPLAGPGARLDVDTPEANSTVHLIRPGSMCSGTLVAPRIVLTAAHCLAHDPPTPSAPRDAAGNWESPGQWYPLYSYPAGGVAITVGPIRSRPRFRTAVTSYSVAGYADVMLLALSDSVPDTMARPAPVLTEIPGRYDPTAFLRDKRFEMAGWGGADSINTIPDDRRIAGATFGEYPNRTWFPDSLRVTIRGDRGTEVRGGDSGGPLYWRDAASGRRHLIGVAQGTERGGGRFFLTFSRGGADDKGIRRPNLSAWLNSHLAPEGLAVLALDGGGIANRAFLEAGEWMGSWHYGSDNAIRGVGDFDADGRDEVIISSDWGIGLVKHTGSAWRSVLAAQNGTRFGGWAFDSRNATIHQLADFDGDRKTDILITSGWGVGILKLDRETFTTLMIHPNGTRFGGWAFSSTSNVIHHPGDFDGDGRHDILITSGWGMAILTLRGTTLTPIVIHPNGTRFGGWAFSTQSNRIEAVGDFNGDGRDDVLITSGWGVAILTLRDTTLTTLVIEPNGTRFGSWAFSSATTKIQGVGDFDGNGSADALVSSDWGVGILALRGATLSTLMIEPNGTRFGGWAYDSRHNTVHAIDDLNGDGRDDIVIRSNWGTGILTLRGTTLGSLAMTPNETVFGDWRFQTRDRVVATGRFLSTTGARQVLMQKRHGPVVEVRAPGTP